MEMRLLFSAICLLTLSGWLLLSNSPNASLAQTFTAPQQNTDEEIKPDDGTTEGSPVGLIPNLAIVNRLTPSRYPATLKAIRVFFRNVGPQSPVGRQIRLLAFARTPSTTGSVNNPTLLVNQNVTIPPVSAAGEFVDFTIQNGPVINSGDFFVGFQQPNTTNVPFFWFDMNEPLQNRGFASTDNGTTFGPDIHVTSENGPFVNFMIRAVVTVPSALTTVSAASFAATGELASEAIGAAFGSNLASGTSVAITLPLPTTLGGASVKVRDSAGTERPAQLFFASPGQINLLLPAGLSNGPALVSVTNASGTVAAGTLNIAAIAPGLFTVDSSGRGFPAALVQRFKPDTSSTTSAVAQFDNAQNRFVAIPIEFGEANDRTFLVLFGTGVRGRSSLNNVKVRVGGTELPVDYAGTQGSLAGLDQINVELPRSLAGRGEIDVVLTVDGKTANTVRVNFK
jgi:uncharacterized protein (TIGR03437 family)